MKKKQDLISTMYEIPVISRRSRRTGELIVQDICVTIHWRFDRQKKERIKTSFETTVAVVDRIKRWAIDDEIHSEVSSPPADKNEIRE